MARRVLHLAAMFDEISIEALGGVIGGTGTEEMLALMARGIESSLDANVAKLTEAADLVSSLVGSLNLPASAATSPAIQPIATPLAAFPASPFAAPLATPPSITV